MRQVKSYSTALVQMKRENWKQEDQVWYYRNNLRTDAIMPSRIRKDEQVNGQEFVNDRAKSRRNTCLQGFHSGWLGR